MQRLSRPSTKFDSPVRDRSAARPSPSLRNLQPLQHRRETGIALQAAQREIRLHAQQASVVLPDRALQPLERLIVLAPPGVGLRDLVRGDVAPFRDHAVEEPLRFGGMTEIELGERSDELAKT